MGFEIRHPPEQDREGPPCSMRRHPSDRIHARVYLGTDSLGRDRPRSIRAGSGAGDIRSTRQFIYVQ
eukprot:6826409-Pyramimonas_sp.AAC.1